MIIGRRGGEGEGRRIASVGRVRGKGKIGYKTEEKMNKAGEIRHCALYVRYLASNHCTGRS